MKSSHTKKIIAPIVIAVLAICYQIGWFIIAAQIMRLSFPYIILGSIIPITLASTMVYVTIQRINEIRSGEEDDLSQY